MTAYVDAYHLTLHVEKRFRWELQLHLIVACHRSKLLRRLAEIEERQLTRFHTLAFRIGVCKLLLVDRH